MSAPHPVRQPRLGVDNPQNGKSGWSWPQTMQCHSLLCHDQAHRSPDSFRSMATPVPSRGATSIVKRGRGCKRPRICPKKVQMAKLPLSPSGEIHTLGTRPWCRKAQSASRGCRLGTAIGVLQGPSDIMKTSRSPAFQWSISSVCGIHTHGPTHAHTTGVVRC